MSSILIPKESVILFLASFSNKDKAEIHFEERDGITPQIYHMTTLDIWEFKQQNTRGYYW